MLAGLEKKQSLSEIACNAFQELSTLKACGDVVDNPWGSNSKGSDASVEEPENVQAASVAYQGLSAVHDVLKELKASGFSTDTMIRNKVSGDFSKFQNCVQ